MSKSKSAGGETVDPGDFYFNVKNLGGTEATGKMAYISRESEQEQAKGREQVPVYNRAGREMTEREKERFIEKAERHGYLQRWQVSPPNGNDLTRDELRKETRRVAHEYTADKRSSAVAYAVHTDQEVNHSHVLLAGDEGELRMNRQDIARTRTAAHERMTEGQRREREREQEQEQEQTREQSREQSRESDMGFES